MRKLIRAPQAKPSSTRRCRKLVYRGLCIDCERCQRKEKETARPSRIRCGDVP